MLVVLFCVLHFGMHLAVHFALVVAFVGMGVLWLAWKARWVLLAIFGLELLLGGRGDDA
ncbi:hypothetical protein [Nitrospirillum amazonense]|uniref:hypothetical protein n=1 Tax=Nitrospirillum amazonense TaxID=28077 RepID=UPI002412E535|nr:hypothetical protein [Nitrospirillum amazonense]MDG3444589.1 hypothetical protein [Nitrospirillum amazonense]